MCFSRVGHLKVHLQEGVLCLLAQFQAWRGYQETGHYTRRAGQGHIMA